MNRLRFSHLAHFEFFLSGARRRILNTTFSAPQEENPNCTQVRKAHNLRVAVTFFVETVAAMTLMFAPAAPVFAQSAQDQINAGLCAGSNLQFNENNSGADCTTSDATTKINNLIHTVVNLLSAIVGVVAVIMIIVGGLRYITSGGNDTSVTGAKNTILYAIIGLIIVALAQILVRFTLSKVTNS